MMYCLRGQNILSMLTSNLIPRGLIHLTRSSAHLKCYWANTLNIQVAISARSPELIATLPHAVPVFPQASLVEVSNR